MGNDPTFLKVPDQHHTVDDIIGTLNKLRPEKIVVIFEKETTDLGLMILNTDLTYADVSWLLDRARWIIHKNVDSGYL